MRHLLWTQFQPAWRLLGLMTVLTGVIYPLMVTAYYQVAWVAQARAISPAELTALVDAHIEGRQWGIFGERRVNVLQLNLALDERYPLAP